MLIRQETAADHEPVERITAEAFARPGLSEPIEVGLLRRLRTGPWWLPALSLVAQDPEGAVAGHVISTRATVDTPDGPLEALGLGPISVLPDRQRAGCGSALMHAALGAADALGHPMVVLLGDPGFYRRFGFEPAEPLGVVAP